MKKTLLALAVLAAGSAQAGVNLYDQDGVLVDLSAAAEVQYYQGYAENSEAKIKLDDGDLALNTTVAVTEQMNVLAGLAFEFEKSAVTSDELWVGFGGDFGTLTFGRQYLISDDAGIGKDIELGGDGLDFVQANGDQAVKYVFDNGQFYAGVSALLTEDGKKGTDDTTIVDGRLGARFGEFDARVYLYSGDDVKATETVVQFTELKDKVLDVEGFNLEGEYNMGAISLAASLGQLEYKDVASSAKVEADVALLAGSYTMGKTTFAAGYTYLDAESGSVSKDANTFYANVTQQLHSNVKVYGEIGTTDVDNSEFGYVAGMEVLF